MFPGARANQIQNIVVGKFDHFRDTLPHTGGGLRLPGTELGVQHLGQGIHHRPPALVYPDFARIDSIVYLFFDRDCL